MTEALGYKYPTDYKKSLTHIMTDSTQDSEVQNDAIIHHAESVDFIPLFILLLFLCFFLPFLKVTLNSLEWISLSSIL